MFISLFVLQLTNILITLLRVHKQFLTVAHTLLCIHIRGSRYILIMGWVQFQIVPRSTINILNFVVMFLFKSHQISWHPTLQ